MLINFDFFVEEDLGKIESLITVLEKTNVILGKKFVARQRIKKKKKKKKTSGKIRLIKFTYCLLVVSLNIHILFYTFSQECYLNFVSFTKFCTFKNTLLNFEFLIERRGSFVKDRKFMYHI